MKILQPAIKWSGSKRSQAEQIISYFPKQIDTYYEPFCGGASVFARLYMSRKTSIKRFVLSDINHDLMSLYKVIQNNPIELCKHYESLWHELNKDDNINRKKEYFASVRQRFNKEHDPMDFMFIMRTTTNGMPRYNQNGEFNNSFHVTRNGMSPNKLRDIIGQWHNMLQDVELKTCSYNEITPNENDFIYLDPPYANTTGMYYGKIDYSQLWDYLSNIKSSWALSFDGMTNKDDYTQNVPLIYDKHVYLKSGNSSFRRVIGNNRNVIVYESLYIKNKS
jgi:DNA adenine methylase